MATEPFLVNPPRRRRRTRNAPARRRRRSNAWPGHRAGHRRAALKGWRRRKRANAPAAAPRRRRRTRRNTWFGHPRLHARASRKGWARRRRQRNPMVGYTPRRRRRARWYDNPRAGAMRRPTLARPFDFMSDMPMYLSAGAGAASTIVAPRLLPVTYRGPWVDFGVQAAVAFGGGALVWNMGGARNGQAFILGGVGAIVGNLIVTFVVPMIPGLSDYELSAYELQAEPEMIEAYPGSSVGAFPGETVGELDPYRG